jgi:alanyl-tRNA synthetase
MDLYQTRNRYIKFYEKNGHAILPSSSIVPENDPTTLFTSSGMQPLIRYFFGEKHSLGNRLVNSQKCFRAEDIDEIGDNRHTTFFEMLGNWSFGDYFKNEQLPWIFEFLTDDLGLDPKKLYVSVFAGDAEFGLQKDEESAKLWKELFMKKGIDATDRNLGSTENAGKLGMHGGRIFYYDSKKNWWSRSGKPANMPVGEPGGPDSEIFYEFDNVIHDKSFGEFCHPNCDCGRYVEIGNSVFMQYVKTENGFELLPQKNVDFGGGLERIVAALNNEPDIFQIDVFKPVISFLETLTNKSYTNPKYTKDFRIIADHIRAAVFIIGAGIFPGNKDRPYIVRRLLRRAMLSGRRLGLEGNLWVSQLAEQPISSYSMFYPELEDGKANILQAVSEEASKFDSTLSKGLSKFETIISKSDTVITATDIFDLYQTYGFPKELGIEMAKENGKTVDIDGLDKLIKEHRSMSKSASEDKFKGGLKDTSAESVKYHTSTHLLNKALREVLGEHISQRGSNITPERLRFDFSHSAKMTNEEIAEVENIVNGYIKAALPVTKSEMSLDDAMKSGVIGVFGERYPDLVSVYSIGEEGKYVSREICGGPHVSNTSQIDGVFKIKKEEAVSQGVRRIRAVIERP